MKSGDGNTVGNDYNEYSAADLAMCDPVLQFIDHMKEQGALAMESIDAWETDPYNYEGDDSNDVE